MNVISEVFDDKRRYMSLLLIGDEQESMIDKYIDRGRLFVMHCDNKLCAVCVVTDEGDFTLEIKNIAVVPEFQRKGLGRQLIEYIEKRFSGVFRRLVAGTGDSPLTVPFYESCGFKRYRIIKDFFIDNYDHLIYEAGVQLCDMICFEKDLLEEIWNR